MLSSNQFTQVIDIVKRKIEKIKNIQDLETLRIQYLGKKGFFAIHIAKIVKLSLEKRKSITTILNIAKKDIFHAIKDRRKKIISLHVKNILNTEKIDTSLPGRRIETGSLHPITLILNDVKDFFLRLGFKSFVGPEIEDDYHNFDALNIHNVHPARSCSDTFWFDKHHLLRTHTSSMQIRIMKVQKPPIRMIVTGKVYRSDYDSTHTPMFHQIEGLVIDKNINFSHLKWMIYQFLYNFFKINNLSIRFRASYFPFTIPSAEVDIKISKENNKWLEVLGCGMVHPNVFKNLDIDIKRYSGFAFGIGVERIAMLRYGIPDLRLFFENNIEFIKQFQ